MERILTVDDLERLAIGAGILGTGGGGNPYLGKIHALKYLKQGVQIRVIDLEDVPDDARVTSVGGMGAPTVGVERLSRGDEMLRAMQGLARYTGKEFTHLIAGEIGGSNAIAPVVVAAQCGLPIIDGDGMGRAFPELQMDTFMIAGIAPTPAVIADHSGHETIFEGISDPTTLERYARAVTIQMGGGAGLAVPVMTGVQVKESAIPGTMSLAIAMGDAVIRARSGRGNPVDAALDVAGGKRLFAGKITNVERRNEGGFARGVLKIDGSGDDAGRGLGRLLAAIANLTMPETVVIGGEGVRLASVASEAVEAGLRADRDPRTAALPLTIRSGENVEWCRGAAVVAIQTFVLGHRSDEP